MASEAAFRLEVLKLLLQVVWADDEVKEREARLVLDLARRWSLPAHEIERLEHAISAGGPLPPPDLGMLRPRRTEVVQIVQAVASVDGARSADEEEIIRQIGELLG